MPINFIGVGVDIPLIVDGMFVHVLLFDSALGLVRAETSFELKDADLVSSLSLDLTSGAGLHIYGVEIHIVPFVILFVLSLPHCDKDIITIINKICLMKLVNYEITIK